MKFSKKTVYAILLMLALAKSEDKGLVTMREIAEKENLSVKYLEQIVNVLCKAGLVKSWRGSKGGYKLAKPAEDYTLGSIIRVIEGNVSADDIEETVEPLNDFMQGLCNTVNNYMDSVTIADLIKKENGQEEFWDYCI